MSSTFNLKIPNDLPHSTSIAIRSINGAKYDLEKGTWEFPALQLEVISGLLRKSHPVLADLLDTSPRFAPARDYVEGLLTSIELSHSTSTDTEIYEPEGLSLYPFQKVGVEFGMPITKRGVLIADEQGLGKTPQGLSIINNVGYETNLIVCPAIVRINWYRESRKWLGNDKWITMLSSDNPNSISEVGKGVTVITNYEMLVKHFDRLKKVPWDCVISDEAHYVKNEKSNRSKAVRKVSTKADKLIGLTGTPMPNGRPYDLWGIINWLDPHEWPNKQDFLYRYCDPQDTYWGRTYDGATNMEELNTILRSNLMIRRLKKDVLKDLPPKQFSVIEVPKASRSIFKKAIKFEDQLHYVVDNIEKEASSTQDPKRLLSLFRNFSNRYEEFGFKERQQVAIEKIPQVISFAESILETGEKVGIFAHHRKVVQSLHEHFGEKSRIVIGGMKDEERQRSIDDFMNNPDVRVCVLSYMAASTGITLTSANKCILAEMAYDPATILQAVDRFHRIGQVNTVNVYFIVLEDSIDARMAGLFAKKSDVIGKALGDE